MPYQGGPDIVRVNQLYVDNSATPAQAPLHIVPSAAPTGTQVAGDIYFDSTTSTFKVSNGVAFGNTGGVRPVKILPATLIASESSALCIFNTAAGQLYTLPTAAPIGTWFDFIVQTTATSGVHRIACATTDFILGTILQYSDSPTLAVARTADGTTHLAWEGNGSTTGGIIGDRMTLFRLNATQWEIYGYNTGTGSEATPFKTS